MKDGADLSLEKGALEFSFPIRSSVERECARFGPLLSIIVAHWPSRKNLLFHEDNFRETRSVQSRSRQKRTTEELERGSKGNQVESRNSPEGGLSAEFPKLIFASVTTINDKSNILQFFFSISNTLFFLFLLLLLFILLLVFLSRSFKINDVSSARHLHGDMINRCRTRSNNRHDLATEMAIYPRY